MSILPFDPGLIPGALRVLRSRLSRGHPPYLICAVTARCNLNCRMCFYHKRLNRPGSVELSLAEWKLIAENTGSVVDLSLSGGEPFLRDDLPEIAAAFSRSNPLRLVSIPTNGTQTDRIAAATAEMLRRLPGSVRLEIELSLDGIGGAQDFVRGSEGCFDRVVATAAELRRLRQEDPRLAIKTVTTAVRSNQDDLLQIIDFSRREIGVDRVVLSPPHSSGRVGEEITALDWAKYYEAATAVYTEDVEKAASFVDRLLSAIQLRAARTMDGIHAGRTTIPCPGPDSICVIAEDGMVYGCEVYRFPLGRIQDSGYSLRRVLLGMRAASFRRKTCGGQRCSWPCGVLAGQVTSPGPLAASLLQVSQTARRHGITKGGSRT